VLVARLAVGLTVRILPVMYTCEASVTAITTSPVGPSSGRLRSVMLPVPLAISSLKVATRFAPAETPVAPLAGFRLTVTGGL
jgi:hypothetical protein